MKDGSLVRVYKIKGVAYKFANKLENNYSHIAENYGRLVNKGQV
mgnify:CR=1 FL=1